MCEHSTRGLMPSAVAQTLQSPRDLLAVDGRKWGTEVDQTIDRTSVRDPLPDWTAIAPGDGSEVSSGAPFIEHGEQGPYLVLIPAVLDIGGPQLLDTMLSSDWSWLLHSGHRVQAAESWVMGRSWRSATGTRRLSPTTAQEPM